MKGKKERGGEKVKRRGSEEIKEGKNLPLRVYV